MKRFEPSRETGLEEMPDRALLKVIEDCNGSDSPIIVEILRRVLRSRIESKSQKGLDTDSTLDLMRQKAREEDFAKCDGLETKISVDSESAKKLQAMKDGFDQSCHWKNEKGEKVD